MPKTLREWLQEGEILYEAAVREVQALETQVVELEARLAEKTHEANQIAQVIGKPSLENNHRLTAQLVDNPHTNSNGQHGSIARAIQGTLRR